MAINSDLPGFLSNRGPRQIFISTDYVFRGLKRSSRSEDEAPDAKCVYGLTKAKGEDRVISAGGVVVRIASPWGIYPSPERAHFVDAIVPKGLDLGKLDMPSDQYFSPTYLPDVSGTILDLATDQGSSGVYHVTNSGHANWEQFTGVIFETIRSKVKVTGSVRGDELRPRYGQLANNRSVKQRHWAHAMVEYLNGNVIAEARR
jgi:dTDP-4-dehydrorhamnose reductase